MAEVRAPYVAVGMTIQWLPHGRSTDEPKAAMCMTVMDPRAGTVELRTFDRHAGGRWVGAVRHIDDPFLKTATAEYLEARGAWRHIPTAPPPEPEKPKAEKK